MITPEEFLKITKPDIPQDVFRLGKIDPAHTSGRPRIVFDGETVASGKQYPHLLSYTPAAGDRVLLAYISGSYVVLGKIV